MLAIARSSLASALVAMRQYDEAEPLLRDSYPIVLATQGERKRRRVARRARRRQNSSACVPVSHPGTG